MFLLVSLSSQEADPIFTAANQTGAGLEGLAEDGDPTKLSQGIQPDVR